MEVRADGLEGAGPVLTNRSALLRDLPRPGGWYTPMQSQAWLEAGYATLCLPGQDHILSVPGGLAPFVTRPGLPTVLKLITQRDLGEPIEPLARDTEAARRLASKLLAENQPVRFGHIPAEGLFTQAFIALAPEHGAVIASPDGGSPVMHLEGLETPTDQMSKRRRSDFRRMERKAAEFGQLSIDLLTPNARDAAGLIDRATAIEAKSWKSRSGTSIAQNPRQTRFLRDFASRASETGALRFAFLTLDGQDAAMQIMVLHDGALWLLKIGYDEAVAKASPGALLMRAVVADAIEQRLPRIEFLGKNAPWTKLWTDEFRPHLRLRYYPHGFRGTLAKGRDATDYVIRHADKEIRRLTGHGEK